MKDVVLFCGATDVSLFAGSVEIIKALADLLVCHRRFLSSLTKGGEILFPLILSGRGGETRIFNMTMIILVV